MGVPGFFVWLVKKYKNIIKYDIDVDIDILYLDANCLIHPQSQKALKKYPNWQGVDYIEGKMLDEIENYIDYLIDVVQPKKLLYIAVDGVAPCAKIKHQRMRRFKSIKYRDQINSLKKKFGMEIDKKWDNSSITPGTEFMQKITERMKRIINKNKYKHLKIIFSSGGVPGEGEHKILQHINNLKSTRKIVVYGLDADLIFLCLASKKTDIYLLREAQHFGNDDSKKTEDSSILDVVLANLENENTEEKTVKNSTLIDNVINDSNNLTKDNNNLTKDNDNLTKDNNNLTKNNNGDDIPESPEELNYLSIDLLRDRLYDEIIKKVEKKINPKIDNIVNDFIFIGYFMGNDFLPNIPSIDIKNKGLDLLIQAYIYCLNNYNIDEEENINHFLNIDENITVNSLFVEPFLEFLSKREDYYFQNFYGKHHSPFCKARTPYEFEKFKLDNLQFYIKDPVKLGKGDPLEWKKRYYKHYFDIEYDNKEQLNKICKEYLKGLLWVSNYYLRRCCSWTWYYPYNNAPMISDIYNFYKENNDFFNSVTFELEKPLDPFIQLLSVLHPSCNYLLPPSLRNLMISPKSPIVDMYPYRFEEDLLGKDMLWKATPILPPLDIARIIESADYTKINKRDMARNCITRVIQK